MKSPRRVLMLIVVTVTIAAMWCSHGQDGPDAGTTAAGPSEMVASQETGVNTTLWGLIKQGGFFMVPLILLSVGAIGLTVYGFMTVQDDKMLHPELVPPLQDELTSLHLERAKEICATTPCLLTNTLLAGLDRISDGVLDLPSMEKAMEEASIQETTEGLKPINYLSIIAQIAPMVGLLGTVSGMIKAFQKIGLGGMGQPEVLADHIGEAMITTAAGLIIGIPAMFFYFYLKNKYIANVSQLARILGNLSHHLVASSRRSGVNV